MTDTTDTGSFRVARSIEIAAPAGAIFPYLVDFHRWTEWSPWEGLDPNLTRLYSGAASGVGAVYEWAGIRKAGQGRMEIVAADAPGSLSVSLQFVKPFASTSVASFTLEPSGAGTRVTWSMVGRKTVMTRIMGVFMSMDKMVGPDFARGLARLAAQVEA